MTHTPSTAAIGAVMQQAATAYKSYRKKSGQEKAAFLRAIAHEIEALGMPLIHTAMAETNLPEARLVGERGRTTGQLRLFADLLEEGSWVEARIDTALPDRLPLPRVDIRKMNVAIGPVVVFGASNFPFAYSTAGGDTASALAAGCPVVVKGHPAHAQTSTMVAEAVARAVVATGMPEGTFAHLISTGFELGKALVQHPHTKAVGFTGSLVGGRALFDLANQRPDPIPVFSEMGSVNPVVLFPEKLKTDAIALAKTCAGSITLGAGQFCTNPGLMLGIDGEDLGAFITTLAQEIGAIAPSTMLHAGIYQNYEARRTVALAQAEVQAEATSQQSPSAPLQGVPTVASVSGRTFMANPKLHEEVFGPYSLVVKCQDAHELLAVVNHLEGQLTASLMATESDVQAHTDIVDVLREVSGRLNFNNVPTGVEVCAAMQHGGPYPASTDGRFGSVGPDAIKRFVRPASYQSFPESLLPDELKTNNPLKIWRLLNGEWTK